MRASHHAGDPKWRYVRGRARCVSVDDGMRPLVLHEHIKAFGDPADPLGFDASITNAVEKAEFASPDPIRTSSRGLAWNTTSFHARGGSMSLRLNPSPERQNSSRSVHSVLEQGGVPFPNRWNEVRPAPPQIVFR